MLAERIKKLQIFLILSGVWTLVGLSFAGISYFATLGEGRPANAWLIILTTLIRFYIWAMLSPLIFRIVKRFDLKLNQNFVRSALIHVPLGLLFSIFHSVIYTLILWQLDATYSERYSSIITFFQEYVFFGSIYVGILLYALIVISLQAFLIYRRYQAEELRSAQFKAALTGAQLQALKMQLQPHFLFNTLHSISSLNMIDPPRANLMIARLGEFLRMTLDHSNDQMVTLAEELNFLRCYLEIEETRFSDRLSAEFNVEPETLSAIVPHLILQPIVENAVKHGIAPHAAPGRITISAKKNEDSILLEIKDNGTGIGKNHLSNRDVPTGKGLQNVRARLEQIYESNFRLEKRNGAKSGLTVILEIPLLPDTVISPDSV